MRTLQKHFGTRNLEKISISLKKTQTHEMRWKVSNDSAKLQQSSFRFWNASFKLRDCLEFKETSCLARIFQKSANWGRCTYFNSTNFEGWRACLKFCCGGTYIFFRQGGPQGVINQTYALFPTLVGKAKLGTYLFKYFVNV